MIGNLGVMYLRAGNAKGAEEAFREALRIRQKNLPGDHWKVADMQSQLGSALAAQGQLDAAEPLLKAGYANLQHALCEEDASTLAATSPLATLQAARRTHAAPVHTASYRRRCTPGHEITPET